MDVTSSCEKYHLSAVIEGHAHDVKCVTATPDGRLISGCRDAVRIWSRKDHNFELTDIRKQGSNCPAVNALAYYENVDSWVIFAGRRDGSLIVFTSQSTEPVYAVEIHSQNITSLAVDAQRGMLLSGSWDNTASVFRIDTLNTPEFSPTRLIAERSLTVLAVAFLEAENSYLTATGDKNVNMFIKESNVKKFKGHTDCVRALLVLNSNFFLSAANDATVRLWGVEVGTCLRVLKSNGDGFIYGLTLLPTGFASISEGGYVEFWKRFAEPEESDVVDMFAHSQIEYTAATSFWSATKLPDGDIAIGASDRLIYVYTMSEERKASNEQIEAVQQAFLAKVAKQLEMEDKQLPEEVVIKVALDDGAPNYELTYKKNTDPADAAAKFLQDYNLPLSYHKEITEYITANIPAARKYVAQHTKRQETQKVEVDGQMWDYAFDVSTDEGKKLRLTYNVGEEYEVAAQRCVEKYNLPIGLVIQFVRFLRQQMEEANVRGTAVSEFTDPYSGASRYVPNAMQDESSSTTATQDPSTEAGSSETPMDTSGDPLTSIGRYIPTASGPASNRPADKKRPQGELCPMTQFIIFNLQGVSTKIKDKLHSTNAEDDNIEKLSEQQLIALERLLEHGKLDVDNDLISALSVGLSWRMEVIAPILDLFRIALLNPEVNKYFCKEKNDFTYQRLYALLISNVNDPTRVFLCRCIANAVVHPWGAEMIFKHLREMCQLLGVQLEAANNHVQIAAATALANISYLLLQKSAQAVELGPREDLIRVIVEATERETSFGERAPLARRRILQAIASTMWGDSDVIKLAKNRDVLSIVMRLKDAVSDDIEKALARDIIEMLHAV